MSERGIWQELDCPRGADIDLIGAEMVHHEQAFRCAWCGDTHVAGVDAQISTYIVPADGADLEYRELPKDAAELAAWRAEYEKSSA